MKAHHCITLIAITAFWLMKITKCQESNKLYKQHNGNVFSTVLRSDLMNNYTVHQNFNLEREVSATPNEYACGIPMFSGNKIVGGSQADEGEWPWQVLLLRLQVSSGSWVQFCGGVLISEKWIVTAAHCTNNRVAYMFRVALGRLHYDVSIAEANSKEYAVSQIINHQDYFARTHENDISLIQIAGSVIYTDYIIPACLPSQGEHVLIGLECWITGWGNTESSSEPRDILREAKVPILSNTQCQSWYNAEGISIKEFHICAGFEAGGVDTCQGDSGGPLVCQENSSSPFILQGITSFGVGCADVKNPGVYARVSEFVTWIETTAMLTNTDTDDFFAIPQTPCGSIITTDQVLRLPVDKETQLYGANTSCFWTIRSNNTKSTTISFVGRFSVEYSSAPTCEDYIQLTTTSSGSLSQKVCGFGLPSQKFVVDNSVFKEFNILFVSDETNQFEGFAVNVTFDVDTNFPTIKTSSYEPPATTIGFDVNVTFDVDTNFPTTSSYESPATTIPSQATYDCGISLFDRQKIVGGSQATRGEWPWQAMLIKRFDPSTWRHICGGTLINKKWIVTAAHCTSAVSSPLDIHIKLGKYFYGIDTQSKEYAVSQVVNHAGYSQTQNTLENDISLIQTAGSVIYTDYIVPVCLPTQGEHVSVGLECWITGWGDTETDETPDYLQEAVVPVLSNAQCQSWYDAENIDIGNLQLCAGFENGGVDSCQGDSGGPLVCQEANSSSPFILQGITSFGVGCADFRNPGVYTRVSEFVNWIEGTLITYPDTDSFFTLPQTPCGKIITANEVIRSPVDIETQLYPANSDCNWTIKPSGNRNFSIVLRFLEKFALESNSYGCFDYIEIVENTDFGTSSIRLCGYTQPQDVVISQISLHNVTVNFHSDATIQNEGFALEVLITNSNGYNPLSCSRLLVVSSILFALCSF